jgi:hypothetical protein
MKLKPIPLKPCPFCGGKMEIKQSWGKDSFSDAIKDTYSYSGCMGLIPKCTACKTEYPKVSVLNLSEEIYNMMMTKLLNEWRK